MPGPFDDALGKLDAAPDSPPPTTPAPNQDAGAGADPFGAARAALDAIPDEQQPSTTAVRAAGIASGSMSPDRAAKVSRLANQTQVPPDVVDKAYEQVMEQRRAAAADYPGMAQYHQALTQWLTEPTHAALAQDDLPQLRTLSATMQALTQDEPPEKLPWLTGVIGPAIRQKIHGLFATLDAGPAWVQQETRDLAGITGPPSPYSPLGMMYDTWDQDRAEKAAQATYQAPDVMRRFVANVAGMAADPTNVVLPVKGAQLAIKATQVIDQAMVAAQGVKGAASVMAEQAASQAVQEAATDRQSQLPSERASTVATAANVAVQASLAYFFGKAGAGIGPLRQFRETPWSKDPLSDLLQDMSRQAVIGANQSAFSTAASISLLQGRAPTVAEVGESAVTGGASGFALGAGTLHEAYLEMRHLETMRNGAALAFGNKLADTFQAAIASKTAQRSPEEVGKLLDAIAEKSQQGPVFLQAEEWQNHFLEQGKDPHLEAERAGLGEQYRQAIALGADMQMPIRAAIGMGVESKNPERLAALFRQDPLAPNVAEAATHFEEAPEREAKADAAMRLLASTEIEAGRGTEDPTGNLIREEMRAQALATGRVTADEATKLGMLHQRFFQEMARKFNEDRTDAGLKPVNATDLFDQFGLRIKHVLPGVLGHAIDSGGMEALLNRLRAPGDLTPFDRAAQDALRRLKLDPTQLKNEDITAALQKTTQEHQAAARAQMGDAHGRGTPEGRHPHGGDKAEADKETHASEVVAKRLGPAKIQELLQWTMEREPHVPVVEAENVPYGMGMDVEGKQAFKDPQFKPEHVLESGKPIDTIKTTKMHEIIETRLMSEINPETGKVYTYSEAHDIANAVEAAYLRHLGHSEEDVKHYEEHIHPMLRRTREWTGEPPAELNTKPYREEGEMHLLRPPGTGKAITLEQEGRAPKGTFSIGKDLASVITLYQGSNRSTAFHETGHFFLEVMANLQARPDAPQSLKDDFAKIMEWTGYGSRENMLAMEDRLAALQQEIGDGTPTEAQKAELKTLSDPHEIFARGFERYLMEGVAPAKGLRNAFRKLKAWMLSVYQDIRNLRVEINPEIRDIFDRMLASPKEIKAAKARVADELAFKEAGQAAMTTEEFTSYQALAGDVDRIEAEELERKLMAVERQTTSQAYKDDREETRGQIADAVAQEKPYQALSALQDGETWDGRKLPEDGTVMKIFKWDVERLLTPEEMMKLPGPGKDVNRGKAIYTTGEHGFTADEAAHRLGYASGAELLKDLMEAADRKQRIEALTDDVMREKYPDPMQDPKLMEQEADKALHAPDLRGQLLDLERAALERIAKIKALTDEADAAEAKAAKKESALTAKLGEAVLGTEARAAADQVRALEREQAARDAAYLKAARKPMSELLAEVRRTQARDERARMRVAAREMIRETKLSAFDPDLFAQAERRSALNVREFMAKGEFDKALEWKRKQMMNAELARAGYEAHEQADKDQAKLYKAATDGKWRQNVAKAGGWEWTVTKPDGTQTVYDKPNAEGKSAQEQARTDALNSHGTYDRTSGYLDQIDNLLEQYDFKRRSPGDLRKRNSLREFLAKEGLRTIAQEGRIPGPSAHIPEEIIADVNQRNWKNLTIDELHGVRSAVEAIEQMAKLKNELISSTGRTDIQEAVNEIITGLKDPVEAAAAMDLYRRTGKMDPKESGLRANAIKRLGSDRGRFATLTNLGSELASMPRIAEEIDGFTEAGPMTRYLIHPQAESVQREHKMLDEVHAAMKEANDAWGKRNDPKAYMQRPLPAGMTFDRILGGKRFVLKKTMSTREKIMLLGYYGHAEGRQRLLDLHGLDDAAVHRIIDTLDAKDIEYANRMVDINGMHWSDIKAMEEKYNGIAPPKVEAIPVELPNGSYKGGYQRIFYDDDVAPSVEQLVNDVITGKDYRRTDQVRTGAGIKRVARVKDKILSLDTSDWERAHYESIHALSHRDMLVNNAKLLSNKDLKAAIVEHWGEAVYRQFRNQAEGLAIGDKVPLKTWQKVIQQASANVSFAGWAFNPAFAVPHISQWPKIAQEVGLGGAMAATAKYVTNPLRMTREVHELSPDMKSRAHGRQRIVDNIPVLSDVKHGTETFGMAMVQKLFWDSHDVIAWKAAYDRHMAESGNDQKQAVLVANRTVEKIAGSSSQKDIPDVRRNPLMKLFTNRMLFDLANWNSLASSANQIRFGAERIGDGGASHIAAGATKILISTIVQGLVWNGAYDLITGKDLKKEAESWETIGGVAKNLAMAAGSSLARCLPILRDMTAPFFEEHGGGRITGTGFIANVQHAVEYANAKHKNPEGIAKAITTGLSPFIPLPTTELWKAWDGWKYGQQHQADFLHQLWYSMAGPPQKPQR